MSNKDHCQIVIDAFEGYAENNLEGKPLRELIKYTLKTGLKNTWIQLTVRPMAQ